MFITLCNWPFKLKVTVTLGISTTPTLGVSTFSNENKYTKFNPTPTPQKAQSSTFSYFHRLHFYLIAPHLPSSKTGSMAGLSYHQLPSGPTKDYTKTIQWFTICCPYGSNPSSLPFGIFAAQTFFSQGHILVNEPHTQFICHAYNAVVDVFQWKAKNVLKAVLLLFVHYPPPPPLSLSLSLIGSKREWGWGRCMR